MAEVAATTPTQVMGPTITMVEIVASVLNLQELTSLHNLRMVNGQWLLTEAPMQLVVPVAAAVVETIKTPPIIERRAAVNTHSIGQKIAVFHLVGSEDLGPRHQHPQHLLTA